MVKNLTLGSGLIKILSKENKMERCIVTGGTGHIGNVLIKELVKRNKKVCALVLPNDDLSPLKDLDIEFVEGDITNREFMFQLIQKDDVVFHLASLIDINNTPYSALEKVNVEGTKNIVDACIENKAKKLIYTSSVHIIDPKQGEVLFEPTNFNEKSIVGNYAKTKSIATEYVIKKAKEGVLDAVVVYPSGVIGPCDYKISELGQVIIDYVNGKLIAYVKGGYNFVDVRDVVDGIISASEKGESGEGYILSGEYLTIKDMLKILNKKIGRKKLPYKIALWFVKIMTPLATLYYKVRNKKPVFTAYSLYTLNTNGNFSNGKAKKFLGYTTRPLQETLFDTVDWFKQNKPELFVSKKKIRRKKGLK